MKAKKTLSLILVLALILPLFCFPASALPWNTVSGAIGITGAATHNDLKTNYNYFQNDSDGTTGSCSYLTKDNGAVEILSSDTICYHGLYFDFDGYYNEGCAAGCFDVKFNGQEFAITSRNSIKHESASGNYDNYTVTTFTANVWIFQSDPSTSDAINQGYKAAPNAFHAMVASVGNYLNSRGIEDPILDYSASTLNQFARLKTHISALQQNELYQACLKDGAIPEGLDEYSAACYKAAYSILTEVKNKGADIPLESKEIFMTKFRSVAELASLNRKAETVQLGTQAKSLKLDEESADSILWWARYYKLFQLCTESTDEAEFKDWVSQDKELVDIVEGNPTADTKALQEAASSLNAIKAVPSWWSVDGTSASIKENQQLMHTVNNLQDISKATSTVLNAPYPVDGDPLYTDSGPDYSTFTSYSQAAQNYVNDYTSERFTLGWAGVAHLEDKIKGILGIYHNALSGEGGDDSLKSTFRSALKTAAYYGTEDSIWPYVGYPQSPWLMTGDVSDGSTTEGIALLILAYQEFGYYCTNVVRNMGPLLSEDSPNLIQRSNEIRAVKSLHDILIFMNDPTLAAVWNMTIYDEDGNVLDYNMSSIYDFLMSSGAFSGLTEYDYSQTESPLRHFFNMSKLSPEIMTGIKASASFIPMATNVYDPYTWSDLVDDEWLLNFHAKFGYNRKALYIDTSKDAALNYTRTKGKGATRVCTLEDLLNPDVDIVLYLDDNFYNINQLSEIVDKAYTRLNNNDEAHTKLNLFQSIGEAISGLWDESMENLAKTARASTYSTKIDPSRDKWKKFFLMVQSEGETDGTDPATKETGSGEEVYAYAYEYLKPDDLLGEDGALRDGYEQSTYTPMTGFAVLSSIYMGSRDEKYNKNLLQTLNRTINQNTPVFISSPTVPAINESLNYSHHQRIIFNYLILKNIDSNMSVDYAVNMDMNSPVYMDIYGNIVTESGYVVVPAAANSTLWTGEYIPYSAAFYATYGNDFTLPYDEENEALNDYLDTWMAVDNGMWVLKGYVTQNGNVDLTRLSTADKDTMAEITETLYTYIAGPKQYYTPSQWQMLITEVLRGAPIEYIDKSFEQLDNSVNTSRGGLIVADKLETLTHALKGKDGTNSNITVPNIAYVDGLEYIIFFVYKILILAIVIIWMVNIYLDAVAGRVGLRTGGKCILAVVLVLSLIVGVPMAFDISYYQSNKLLLQDETQYLMMLNLEKEQSGQEIGITSIRPPETTTKLYLKLADIKIPWWELFGKIAMSSTYRNMEELYAEYEGMHPIASANDVTVRNESVYVAVDDLFNSSTISFSPTTKNLFQYSRRATPCSYYTPYYVFLDNIIASSNAWCAANEYYSYTSKIMAGGKLKTFGFIKNYFASEEFLSENYDFFNLYQIYGVDPPRDYQYNIDYESVQNLISGTTNEGTVLDNIRNSQWCNYGAGSQESTAKRIQKVNNFAKTWVAENYNMIGKVSDETFLKCFALACACEHNRVFNTMRADYLEIDQLSQEDLMRMSIADKDAVMRYSTMSYARFVYTVGGTTAVYAAALASLVNFVASWVKPACTILVFLICCASIFILKLILRRGNNSIWGYCTTIGLMCSINVLGAVITKLSMYLPSLGFSPTVCLIIQILIQVVYLSLLVRIVKTALKDWTNVGYNRYDATISNKFNRRYRSTDYGMPRQANAWGYYNNLVERDRRRRTGAIYGR